MAIQTLRNQIKNARKLVLQCKIKTPTVRPIKHVKATLFLKFTSYPMISVCWRQDETGYSRGNSMRK